jgi:serine/threonine protein kinase
MNWIILLDFGLTYCPNGDLLQYITDAGHLEEEAVRFYAAELIEALEQLHNRRIVHRDLKVSSSLLISMRILIDVVYLQPENILLTDDMHIQLTDFGSAVIMENNDGECDQEKEVSYHWSLQLIQNWMKRKSRWNELTHSLVLPNL